MARIPGLPNTRRRVDITAFDFDKTLEAVTKIGFEGEEFVDWADASKLVADAVLFFDCDTVVCPDLVSSVEDICRGSMVTMKECAPHIRTPAGRFVRARAIPSADGEVARGKLYFRLSTLMDKINEKRHWITDFTSAEDKIAEVILPLLDAELIDEMSAYIADPMSLQQLILYDLIVRDHVRFYRIFAVSEGTGRFPAMGGGFTTLEALVGAMRASRQGLSALAKPYWPENGVNADDLLAFLAQDGEGYAAAIMADNGSALLAPLLGAPLTPQALYLAVDNDATADPVRSDPPPAAEAPAEWDATTVEGRGPMQVDDQIALDEPAMPDPADDKYVLILGLREAFPPHGLFEKGDRGKVTTRLKNVMGADWPYEDDKDPEAIRKAIGRARTWCEAYAAWHQAMSGG